MITSTPVQLKKEVCFTREVMANRDQLHGKQLKLIEKNRDGDCLCFFPETNCLVDVDHRDIEKIG